VEIEGEELTLTVLEYDILFLLMKEPDKVYSRENLYEMVWKDGYYGEDNTINVHISNLRRKLAAADPEEEYIRTVWGIGFKMA
jgi:DNA-binding response OmpR family regulator